jgi:hypothetical protein
MPTRINGILLVSACPRGAALGESLLLLVCVAAGKKKVLNVGRSGGSAGLDDYQYDDPLDDDVDFM